MLNFVEYIFATGHRRIKVVGWERFIPFAEKCAETQLALRVDRAATADECDYIRKWLGYSRNFTILLSLEFRYHH